MWGRDRGGHWTVRIITPKLRGLGTRKLRLEGRGRKRGKKCRHEVLELRQGSLGLPSSEMFDSEPRS
jgi:hypothetical protein